MFDNNLPWQLDHHRYAVLGVPRSGTQLLESFIKYSLSKNHNDVAALQEIFSVHGVLVDTVTLEDRLVKVHNRSNVPFYQMMEVALQKLDLVKQADMNQPMVCRVFLDDRMGSVGFNEGLEYLKELNFKFVYINRRFDHKILSGIFSWKSFIFNKIKNTNTLTIDIDELKNMIVARYLIEQRNFAIMQKAIPEYYWVEYDSLAEKASILTQTEQEAAFGIYEEKQLPLDPYDQIENKDEVRKVFEEFYPKLQLLANDLLD